VSPTPAPRSRPAGDRHQMARELITRHGGRVTRTRIAVIETLLASDQPLSHDELGSMLAEIDIPHDRVTLYRALDWLVEHGIARRIAGGDRAWRFEAARADGHRHAHFHCDHCGQVICLEHLEPSFSTVLPDGYRVDRAELILHGACASCSPQRSANEPCCPH